MDSGVSLKKYRATWCSVNFITLIIITLILIWFKIFIGTNCSSYECWCYFLPFLISIKSTDPCFLIIENESLMDSCIHMEFQSVALTLWVNAQILNSFKNYPNTVRFYMYVLIISFISLRGKISQFSKNNWNKHFVCKNKNSIWVYFTVCFW